MRRKKITVRIVAALLVVLGGYAGVQYYLDHVKMPPVQPREVVEQYFNAVKNRQFEAAYGMVSRDFYHESINQFIDRVSTYAPDMALEVNTENIEDNRASVGMRVVVPMRFGVYESDTEMTLIRQKREWKIIHP